MHLASAHTTHLRGASRHVKEMPWEVYFCLQAHVIPWEEGSTAQIHAVVPTVRENHPQQCHNSQLGPAKPLQELLWSLGRAGAVSRPAVPEFWGGLGVFGFPHLTLLVSPGWGFGGCSQGVKRIQQWGCANLHPLGIAAEGLRNWVCHSHPEKAIYSFSLVDNPACVPLLQTQHRIPVCFH